MDVSIIIVSWNTRDVLRGCLQSIYSQADEVQFEVIVIDNHSSDGSAEMVKSTFPGVILVANADNRGFAAANNQGIVIARGRYVLLLNPDTVVLDGAIQKAVRYADAHPEAAVVGCQVWLNSTEIQRTCFAYPSIKNIMIQMSGINRIFPRSRFVGKVNYGWWDRRTPMEVDVVSGMFMLVRKSAMEEVGIMDESYFVYAEETDWCYRFTRAGWKCLFTPDARIIHLDGGGVSTSQVSVKMYVQMQKSLLIFMRKHFGVLAWSGAKMLFVVSMLVRILMSMIRQALFHDNVSKQKVSQSRAALRFHCTGAKPE